MLVLKYEICKKWWSHRASSVEVFFVDAELVTNKLYGSRWEELSCGCDAEGGDLLSVCEHPSAE